MARPSPTRSFGEGWLSVQVPDIGTAGQIPSARRCSSQSTGNVSSSTFSITRSSARPSTIVSIISGASSTIFEILAASDVWIPLAHVAACFPSGSVSRQWMDERLRRGMPPTGRNSLRLWNTIHRNERLTWPELTEQFQNSFLRTLDKILRSYSCLNLPRYKLIDHLRRLFFRYLKRVARRNDKLQVF